MFLVLCCIILVLFSCLIAFKGWWFADSLTQIIGGVGAVIGFVGVVCSILFIGES